MDVGRAREEAAPPTAYGEVQLLQLGGRDHLANAVGVAAFYDDPEAAAWYASRGLGCSLVDIPGTLPMVSAGELRFEIGPPPSPHVLPFAPSDVDPRRFTSKQLSDVLDPQTTGGFFSSARPLRFIATGAEVRAFEASLTTADAVAIERPEGDVWKVRAGAPFRMSWKGGSNDLAWLTLRNKTRVASCVLDAGAREVEVPAAVVAAIAVTLPDAGASTFAAIHLEIGRETRVRAGRFDIRVRSVDRAATGTLEVVP